MGIKKKKIPVKSTLRVKIYPVLEAAVYQGVKYGYNRAFKHGDDPRPSDEVETRIIEHIEHAVMSELCEALEFNDYDEDEE